jgi:HSP20 family protein
LSQEIITQSLFCTGDLSPTPTFYSSNLKSIEILKKKLSRPRVDLIETSKLFIVKMELGGSKKENISIKLDGQFLSIIGTKGSEETEDDVKYIFKECNFGKFFRKIRLPQPVKHSESGLLALYENGILIIELEKY